MGNNTDLIIMKEALLLLRKKIINIIKNLSDFAEEHKALPTLGFTHFQAAQPTTVGKRATLWINELVMDLTDIDHILGDLKLLSSKGTTGTQATFLELFEGRISPHLNRAVRIPYWVESTHWREPLLVMWEIIPT